MPTVLDADLRPCCAVSRASILSNQTCSSCSVASVSRSKVRPAVCSRARDTFDYAGPCACAAGSRMLLTPFQPHVLGLVPNGICVLSVFRCQPRAAGARGATLCSPPTRNGPQRAELTTAEDAPSHTAAMLCVGAREHTRCAPRASELCQSQCNRCALCALCVLCVGVAHMGHSCSMDSLR